MEFTLEELGLLSSYTRRKILKVLSEKRQSVTGISEIMGRSKSAMHEQLQKLNQKGFVKRVERKGHKDVYYELSEKGSSLMKNELTVISMTAVFMLAGIAGVYSLWKYFAAPFMRIGAVGDEGLMAEKTAMLAAAPETFKAAPAEVISRNPLWLALGLLLIIIAALVVYSMFRKRKK